MIRRSVVLVAMLAAAGAALAQAPSPPAQWQGHHHRWQDGAQWRQQMEQRRMDRLTILLDLTPAQRQRVQGIFADEHAKMQTAMQQVRQAMRQARAAHQAARKETLQQLGSVLSPAQMKKLKALMPGPGMMHEMMMHRMMMHGMGMGPHAMGGPGPGPGPR